MFVFFVYESILSFIFLGFYLCIISIHFIGPSIYLSPVMSKLHGVHPLKRSWTFSGGNWQQLHHGDALCFSDEEAGLLKKFLDEE